MDAAYSGHGRVGKRVQATESAERVATSARGIGVSVASRALRLDAAMLVRMLRRVDKPTADVGITLRSASVSL